MVDDSLNVSSVTTSFGRSIGFFESICRAVVIRISVRKAIRHQQINHIRAVKSLAFGRILVSLLELVIKGLYYFFRSEERRVGKECRCRWSSWLYIKYDEMEC